MEREFVPIPESVLAALAIAICQRRVGIVDDDPVVRAAWIWDAWDFVMKNDYGQMRFHAVELLAGAIGLARRLGFQSDRMKEWSLESGWHRPEYTDIRLPSGTRLGIECAGIVLVADSRLATFAKVFIQLLLLRRAAGQHACMNVAWQGLVARERFRLEQYFDDPQEAVRRVAMAAGLRKGLIIRDTFLIEVLTEQGENFERPSRVNLSELRRRRIAERQQTGRAVSCLSQSVEDKGYRDGPEYYNDEIRAALQAAHEDCVALTDNLYGKSPAELE